MTDAPQKWIFVAPETFGDWTCGEWSTEGDGALLHSDVQVLYALAKDMIPRAEADAMVAAAVERIARERDAEARYWSEACNDDERVYHEMHAKKIRAITPADARAAFDQAVQDAVEAERARWQDISTAPRDGRRMLLAVPFAGKIRVVVGGFDNHWSGQCWTYDSFSIKVGTEPAAWQPLPDPPQ